MRHVVAFATALSLIVPELGAQAAPETAAAAKERAQFKAAQRLYEKRDYTGALVKFGEIESPNAHLYAGRCLRELGKLPEAYEEFTRAIRDATQHADAKPHYAITRDAASTERAALTPQIGLLTIASVDRPAGLVVKVSGRTIADDRIGEAIAVAPGAVVVEASANGRQDFRKQLAIGAGASELLAVTLPPKPPKPVAKPPPRPIGNVRIAGFAVVGLGLVGWGTFAAAGVLANRKYTSVSAACGGKRCIDPAYNDMIRTGRALDVAADIGLATGIAGVAGGAAMIVFGGPRDKRLLFNASPTGAWLGLRQSY